MSRNEMLNRLVKRADEDSNPDKEESVVATATETKGTVTVGNPAGGSTGPARY